MAAVDPVDLTHADAHRWRRRRPAGPRWTSPPGTARHANARSAMVASSAGVTGDQAPALRRVPSPLDLRVDAVAVLHAAGPPRPAGPPLPPRSAGTRRGAAAGSSSRSARPGRRSSKPGATTTSVKISATCSAIRADTGGWWRRCRRRPTPGRRRVPCVGLGDVRPDRDAAGVGVLDDGDGRLVEVVGGAAGGVGVDVVVVGHLLAVQLRRLRQPGAVGGPRRAPPAGAGSPRSAAPRALPGRAHPAREAGAVGGVGTTLPIQEATATSYVGGVDERLGGQLLPRGEREPARPDGSQHGRP
jgi:hypothetical protein